MQTKPHFLLAGIRHFSAGQTEKIAHFIDTAPAQLPAGTFHRLAVCLHLLFTGEIFVNFPLIGRQHSFGEIDRACLAGNFLQIGETARKVHMVIIMQIRTIWAKAYKIDG